MDDKFVKAAKQLNKVIFQLMEDSQQEVSTYDQFKTYLISVQCSQIQHLSCAWDFQWQDGDKLKDFVVWHESTIKEAAILIKAKFKADSSHYHVSDI